MNPAIVVVAYNRKDSLKRLLNSLTHAKYPSDNIQLIISIDNHSDNGSVVDVARKYVWMHGNKIVKTHPERMGLRAHVLECGDYALTYGTVIILEDDLVVSPDFYYYTCAAQQFYQDNHKIAGVALYSHEWNGYARNMFRPLRTAYDSYFGQFSITWGQSWSADQWKNFREWYQKHPILEPDHRMPENIYQWPETSWGKYFAAYIVDTDRYYIIPYVARSSCFSDVGEHTYIKDVSNQVNISIGCQRNFQFPQWDEGVHYDIFFESKDLSAALKQWTGKEAVTIDLFGLHSTETERYLLTTKRMPYKIIHSFGLEMRPLEQNILMNIPGKQVFLYDTSLYEKFKEISFGLTQYDLSGYHYSQTLSYTLFYLYSHGKMKIKNFFKIGR